MKKDMVSILICTFNSGLYLEKTIKSIQKQTHVNWELLIYDNSSQDGTIEYLYQIQSEKIKVFFGESNIGAYGGLNFLLKKSTGDYIAIQDHDDIWHSEKLKKQIDFLNINTDLVGCGTATIMFFEEDKKYFSYYLKERNYYTVHPSLLFRKNDTFYYDISQTEYMCDAWSIKNNLCQGQKCIGNINEDLTLHLIKKGNANYSYKWFQINFQNMKRIFELHNIGYGIQIVSWELFRKILYPFLNIIHKSYYIQKLEKIPFILGGNRIKGTNKSDWWNEYV